MHELDDALGRELPDEAIDVEFSDDDDEIDIEVEEVELLPGLEIPAQPPRP